jgi:hypothetical protein
VSRVAPAGFARSDSGPSQREGASIGSVKRMADDVFRQYWAEALRTLAKIADDPTVPWHEREHVRRALLTRIKGLECCAAPRGCPPRYREHQAAVSQTLNQFCRFPVTPTSMCREPHRLQRSHACHSGTVVSTP